ncbi:MAG TPA: hypothetical protein VFL41_02730 [Gaiellaceae bacterium]|nr:hypothetical protein [Gaiellaceae bacterium]
MHASSARSDPAPAADTSRHGSPAAERTVASYFGAFGPAPEWDELVRWPPDVFALANLVLDHTESYRFVIAPPAGRCWPPLPNWNAGVRTAGRAWTEAVGAAGQEPPALVRDCWDTVTRRRETPLESVRTGDAWELVEALLTLHAAADEACADIGTPPRRESGRSFEALAWRRLQDHGSLSRLAPARARIVPKTNLCAYGITISSLSRYLALSYESVDIRWRSVEPETSATRRDYNIVLVPWPLSVAAGDFRPVSPIPLENMDADLFGFFEFAPERPVDHALLGSLLQAAVDQAGRVDAVILPEDAVTPHEAAQLERTLDECGASLLIAGVRQPPTAGSLGRNYLHFGVRTSAGWERYEQDKHHRWCLDEGQIRQYHLTRSLNPGKLWWEAIDVRERTLHVVDVGRGLTSAPLVCEDLARLDEVADVVRRIGPSLVVAVLLDGPQLSSRWSSRYASILADEPGSTVLTLTSYGMAARSRPPGKPRSRVVAHWNNRADGPHEIELAPRAGAVLLTARVEGRTLWTADGRCHSDVPGLTLSEVRQLHRAATGLSPPRPRANRQAVPV